MTELILYRMPDENVDRLITQVCYVLALNGVPLLKSSQELPWSRISPEPPAPEDMITLSKALEKALGVRTVYRDTRPHISKVRMSDTTKARIRVH